MQGIITAPMLYAMEEFPQLHDVVDQGFDNPANVELVSNYFNQERLLSFQLFILSTYRVKTNIYIVCNVTPEGRCSICY
jgi:hypothetical protein